MKNLIAAVLLCGSMALAPAAQGETVRAGTGPEWAGAWGYATSPATGSVKAENPAGTYRYRMRVSQSGDAVRLTVTNPDGAQELKIATITVARAADRDGFALDAQNMRPVTLAAGSGAALSSGQTIVTQPVGLAVKAGDDLIVEIATSAPSTTVAGNAGFPASFAPTTGGAAGATLQTIKVRPLVTQIAVRNPSAPCTIVTLGDSITEGARGTRPDWRGWPGVLARRLTEKHPKSHCGVVNMGISGNRLLRDGRGTAAINRFERDVASVPGVSHLILLEGVNDIWRATLPGEPALTADDLIAGYRKLIAAAHARNIRIIGATITPGFGWKAFTPAMEDIRQKTNAWIRSSGEFDAVIDFEAALRDTATPPVIKRAFDSGDHLHPGNAGYEAMGRAIPLSLFQPAR
ncbi:SGNH/GDSL hydrolase family protein (plasmid) [Novosphingobium sp. BL-8A]|uniref:SGNH/GDSL hydrolase family protein n=1 Tax=Novosphingobium sp. BL-8A TaxID=3127639 RepID=UPI0037564F07